MDVQWYPGQMAKAKRVLRENLKLVDAVIEVLDARLPVSSRNPDIRELLARRPVVAVLTRPDLADPVQTAAWLHSLREEYFAVAAVNGSTGEGIKKLLQQLRTLPRRRKHGQRPLRLIIVGIPNVGKSSLINRLIGRSVTQTGDKPGITKQPQWVRLQAGLELLDTPGMLWPKINCKSQAFRLAAAGAVKDEIFDPLELGIELISFMRQHFGEQLRQRYDLENATADAQEILAEIAKRRGCLLKGGNVDLEAASRLLVKDLREGRLGRITFEKPGELKDEAKELCPDDGRGDLLLTE
ncbi:MAG: ribosome biogenesis GTPase YlqF [Dethiobacter sp.]|jgi:ribosome biogenesis GTPase A|nr:ribosome biogenesis GTPase YlqF [Dethiobacter sp.]MBS3899762.1 ribosome biogenesis GTPase YlqF [Dethiobacter sp.]MBS3982742.1 ribosome biogenesis GTPase YlqF [Dethiobacter sp.]MCL4464207.1 ribosome biogenesis GTPase YlqF [Bacillota bacterium]MCL5993883.1 ribosome biogenesis GTPase YlqF [Bacillota bacterium]